MFKITAGNLNNIYILGFFINKYISYKNTLKIVK